MAFTTISNEEGVAALRVQQQVAYSYGELSAEVSPNIANPLPSVRPDVHIIQYCSIIQPGGIVTDSCKYSYTSL